MLKEGLTLAGTGLTLGALAAVVLARFLQRLLFEVAALDATTFMVTGIVLAAVAIGASWLPALRATRVDPNLALRTN